MKKMIALDISSSTIGWSVFSFNKDKILLSRWGHIKPTKKGTLAQRAIDARIKVKKIFLEEVPDEVVVEDYASKFSSGRSTARTIIVLAVFNEAIKMLAHETLSISAYAYPVRTIRSVVSKNELKDISDKDKVLNFCSNKFKKYSIVMNRNNNVKKECYDECDSMAVGVCHFYKAKGE